MQTGKIIKSISGFYDVLTAEGKVERTRARGNFRKQKIKPVVGDHVEFEDGYILAIKPRQNVLVRPPMANLDLAIVVMSAVEPDFSTNLLDRYLVYLAANNMEALIYVSKIDLLSEQQLAQLMPLLQQYGEIGYRVYSHGTADFSGIKEAAAGKTLMVMGQSGAGKSTLLNYLLPELKLATAEISQSLNRGRHTTRTVTLYPIGVGGAIADTPGFSSLDLSQINSEDLGHYFIEFLDVSGQCRFRGCQHLREPDCAVKAAVEAGTIAKFRYADYVQLHDELGNLRPTYRKS